MTVAVNVGALVPLFFQDRTGDRMDHELPKLPKIEPSDIFWSILAVIGCLGMIAFEMVLTRVSIGKW